MPFLTPERHRAFQRSWWAKRRAAWIAAHGPCARCGSSDDLQVDHVDPSTKLSHRVWSWSAARRARELAKCQVLCGCCHRAKTACENAARPAYVLTPRQRRAQRRAQLERLRRYWMERAS